MNAEKLKASLLQEAMSGKLVPQRDDEPEVKQIGDAIKDVPFEIPAKWKWVNLGSVIQLVSGRDLASSQILSVPSTTPYITGASQISDGSLIVNRWTAGAVTLSERKDVLLVCKGSGVGKVAVNSIGSVHIARQLMALRSSKCLDHDFLLWLTKYIAPLIAHGARGVIPGISRQDVMSFPIPLPPLAEQRRIVARLNALLPLVEEYGKAQEKLDALNAALPGKLHASLLQEAISGRLVPQRDDEPEVNQIGDAPDEVPFEIPEKWKIVYLKNCVELLNGDRGKNYPAKSTLSHVQTNNPFVSAINMENGKVSDSGLLYLTDQQFNSLRAGKIKRGDRLLCIRGSLGKHCYVEKNGGAIASSLIILRNRNQSVLEAEYLDIWLDSSIMSYCIKDKRNGTAQPNLSAKDVGNFLLPLPPLAEQRRIVARLNEILPEVDNLAALKQ